MTILPSTSHTFSAAGGSWSIEVYHTGTAPEVMPSDDWITITWREFSNNGSYYNIQVPAYSGTGDRTGTIDFEKIQGDEVEVVTVTITQQGAAQGTIYVDPSVLVWNNQGGQRTFLVAGSAALSGQSLGNGMYTVADWITNVSYSSAGGEGYFYNITAASHQPDPPSDIYREDTVDIDGEGGVTTVLDIVQGEIVTAASQMDINGLGTYTGPAFGVYFKDRIAVTKDLSENWYSVSVRTSQPGYNIYNVSASQNNTGQTRTGTVTFDDKYSSVSVPVVQTPLGEVSFDKIGLSYSSSAGTENVNITYTQSGASYWVSDNWITLSEVSSDPVNKTVTVAATAASNTGQDRTTTLWAQATDGVTSVSIPVIQRGEAEVSTTVNPSSLSFGTTASTLSTSVSYSGTLTYSIPQGEDWVSVSTIPVTASEKTAYVTVSTNPSANSRGTNITFTGSSSGDATLGVFQTGAAALSVSPSSLTFGSTSSTSNVSVTNFIGSVTTSKSGDWISIGTPLGVDVRHFPISVARNSGAARNGWVSFTDSRDITKGVYVEQASGLPVFTVSSNSLSFTSTGGELTFSVTFPSGTARSYYEALTYSQTGDFFAGYNLVESYSSNNVLSGYTYKIYAGTNTGSAKTGTITITDNNTTAYINVSQEAGQALTTMTVSTSKVTFGPSGGFEDFTMEWTASRGSTTNIGLRHYIGHTFAAHNTYGSSGSTSGFKTYKIGDPGESSTHNVPGLLELSNGLETFNILCVRTAGTAVQTYRADPATATISQDTYTTRLYIGFLHYQDNSQYTPTISYNYVSGDTGYVVSTTRISGNNWPVDIYYDVFNIVLSNNHMTQTSTLLVTLSDRGGSATTLITYTAGGGGSLSVSPSTLSFVSGGETKTVSLTNVSGSVTNTHPAWITSVSTSDSGSSQSYSVEAAYNNTAVSRSGDLIFTDSNNTPVTVAVSQAAGGPSMTFTPSSLSYTSSGGVESVKVEWVAGTTPLTQISYPAGGPSDWITSNYVGPGGLDWYETEYQASANTSSSRTATILYNNGIETIGVPVTQEAGTGPTPSLSVSPSSFSFGYSGGRSSDLLTITYNQTNYTISFPDAPDWINFIVKRYTETGVEYYVETSANTSQSSRSATITATGSIGGTDTFTVSQDAAPYPALSVNTNNLSFTSASGHQSVTVTNISGALSYTPSVNWVTVNESGSGSSRLLSVRVSENNTASSRSGSLAIDDSRQNPVSVAITQDAGQAPIDTISFSPVSFTFNAVDTTQKILTVTHPDGWLNFDKNYQQGSGWLTVTLNEYVDNNTTKYNVYITDGYDNTGNARTCYLDFTSYSGATGRVVVTQQVGAAPPPASGDYIPVWRDYLYSPSGFTNGQDYAYSLRGSGGTVLYQGVTVAPDSSHTPDPINITRLVESYVNSGEFNYTSGSWKKLPGELTVNFYKVGQVGLIKQWLIWNDWSRYKLVYDSISTLNDPINFRACQGMKLPLCVYQKGTTSWSMTEVKKNGTSSTTSFSYPSSYKFAVYVPSYTGSAKRLDFKRGGNTQFSYDMTACGQGYFLYRNRFGGWDSFLIEGNIYKKEGYARQNYTSPVNTSYGYSVDRHTDKVNITTSYEVHTGWLTDQEAERLVYHLLSSPKVYFTSFEGDHYELGDMKEVILTGSQAEYKKYRNGRKLTSYTITFDAADTKRVQR